MTRDEAYLLVAKEAIERAYRSRTTRLDLSNMQLTKLPELPGQLTEVIWLELSGNQITVLPEWLEELTQLRIT